MLQAELEKANTKQLSNVSGLEEQLAHAQDSLKKMADRLKETETELSSVHGDLRLLRDNTTRESGSLTSQLKETQTKLESLTESSTAAEEEHRTARDAYRQELHKAESECRHLRDALRKERDLLEKLMRDQAGKESEHAEQRQRFEDQSSRREMALSARLQSTEKELDALRLSSVPESKIRSLQDQFDREREQLQTRLDMALEDAARAQQQKTVGLREMEQHRLTLSTEADLAGSKVRSLEAKLREAEEMYASERKARLLAADQLRAFKGEFPFQQKIDDVRLTKIAQAAMESVGDAVRVFELIEKGLMDPSRDNLDRQQRTALGIVVVENIVEETIPGSPADVCGLISAGDEIVAVDGKAVEGSSVAAALRGDDLIGGVVSVMIRKQSNEVLEVHLPRADIIVVSTRRQLCEDLAEFSAQAVQAAQTHQLEVLGDRLHQILASMKALEQLDVNVQYRLSMQVAELTKGFHNAIKSAFQGIQQVDHAHQQAHSLQDHTEEDLRAKLAQRNAEDQTGEEAALSSTAELHAEIQAIGRDFRQVQNELRARNMQVAEAKRDAERLREALILAEEKAVMFEEGQKSMRGTVMAMEEELADAVAQVVEFPFAIAVGLNLLWDTKMLDDTARSALDSQLREDVALALQIPKNAVSAICYHRDDGQVIVVLKLCNVMPSGSTMHSGLRTSKSLAAEFAQQIADLDSLLRSTPIGSLMKECVLHGPVSEMTAKAINMARLDAERDAGWRYDEVLRLQDQIRRAEDRAKQATETHLKETEALRLEKLDLVQKSSQETKEGAERSAHLAQQHLERQYQVHMTELKRKQKAEIEDWERAVKTKEYEISVLKEQLAADEIRNSSSQSDKEKGYEIARSAQDAYHKLQVASAQMRDLIEPEIKACINTLENVESEMAFFHAHQMRVLQIAMSMSGASLEDTMLSKDQADAAYSKEMVERDIEALRSQLTGLADLTAVDGELARKFQLPRLVSARMTPSRAFFSGERDGAERSEGGGQDSPALPSASRRLVLEEHSPPHEREELALAVQGCVVAVQNLPVATELEGKHISVAISLLPSNVDPHTVEHVLPGSSDISNPSLIPFSAIFGSRTKGRRGKTGKEITLINPQHHTKEIPATASPNWQPEETFCLSEHHSLQAADASEGIRPSPATKLGGDMATLLVTLMAGGGDGDVPCFYARCIVNMMTGDNVDKVSLVASSTRQMPCT